MEKNKMIKILSNELLKGSKMLSTHCPNCNCPLFEKDGKIYCPICKVLEREKYTEEDNKTNNSNLLERRKHENTLEYKKDRNGEVNKIDEIINKKLEYLLDRLNSEYEVCRIKEISESIYLLLKIKYLNNKPNIK